MRAIFIHSKKERKKEKRREREASRGDHIAAMMSRTTMPVVFAFLLTMMSCILSRECATAQFQNDLPTIPSVQSLRSGEYDAIVENAFFGSSAPGVLFVGGLNGFEDTRRESLRRLAECAKRGKTPPEEEPRVQEDVFLHNPKSYSKEHPGVERSTLAEFANKRLSIDVNAECAGRSAEEDGNAFDLRRELEKLRDFADVVSQATLPRLDAILNAREDEEDFR